MCPWAALGPGLSFPRASGASLLPASYSCHERFAFGCVEIIELVIVVIISDLESIGGCSLIFKADISVCWTVFGSVVELKPGHRDGIEISGEKTTQKIEVFSDDTVDVKIILGRYSDSWYILFLHAPCSTLDLPESEPPFLKVSVC